MSEYINKKKMKMIENEPAKKTEENKKQFQPEPERNKGKKNPTTATLNGPRPGCHARGRDAFRRARGRQIGFAVVPVKLCTI
jgi:hypothetical protein